MLFTRWRRALLRPVTERFPADAAPWLFPPGARPVEVLRTAPPGPLATSLAIRHIDVGSCGGPESELSLLAAPPYDISRFGFTFTPSPRHADLLLVTGSLTPAMEPLLRETYEAMPAPRRVIVLGACGAWAGCPLSGGSEATFPIARVVPVDVFVPGCPPAPAAIIAGLFAAVGRRAPGLRGWLTPAAPAHGPGKGGGLTSDSGGTPSEWGGTPPDSGGTPSEWGGMPSDSGGTPSEWGGTPPDSGGAPPDSGGTPSDSGGTPAAGAAEPPAPGGGRP